MRRARTWPLISSDPFSHDRLISPCFRWRTATQHPQLGRPRLLKRYFSSTWSSGRGRWLASWSVRNCCWALPSLLLLLLLLLLIFSSVFFFYVCIVKSWFAQFFTPQPGEDRSQNGMDMDCIISYSMYIYIYLIIQWLTFKLLRITYLVSNMKFYFQNFMVWLSDFCCRYDVEVSTMAVAVIYFYGRKPRWILPGWTWENPHLHSLKSCFILFLSWGSGRGDLMILFIFLYYLYVT